MTSYAIWVITDHSGEAPLKGPRGFCRLWWEVRDLSTYWVGRLRSSKKKAVSYVAKDGTCRYIATSDDLLSISQRQRPQNTYGTDRVMCQIEVDEIEMEKEPFPTSHSVRCTRPKWREDVQWRRRMSRGKNTCQNHLNVIKLLGIKRTKNRQLRFITEKAEHGFIG